jgi:hypothetical protein
MRQWRSGAPRQLKTPPEHNNSVVAVATHLGALNSPYECPHQHWELDSTGQPTGQIVSKRRRAEFITPIPKPKKQRAPKQRELSLDEGKGLSTAKQKYDLTSIINEVRQAVDSAASGHSSVRLRRPRRRSG